MKKDYTKLKKKLPYLLNTRFKQEKGASHASMVVVDERRAEQEIANGERPLTVEEHTTQRRFQEELERAKLRELRETYNQHLKESGR